MSRQLILSTEELIVASTYHIAKQSGAPGRQGVCHYTVLASHWYMLYVAPEGWARRGERGEMWFDKNKKKRVSGCLQYVRPGTAMIAKNRTRACIFVGRKG